MQKIIILLLVLSIFCACSSCAHKNVNTISRDTSTGLHNDISMSNVESQMSTNDTTNLSNTNENDNSETRIPEITSNIYAEDDYGDYYIENVNGINYIKTSHIANVGADDIEFEGAFFYGIKNLYDVLSNQTRLETNQLNYVVKNFEKNDNGYQILSVGDLYDPILPECVEFVREWETICLYLKQYSYMFYVKSVSGETDIEWGRFEVIPDKAVFGELMNNANLTGAYVLDNGDMKITVKKSDASQYILANYIYDIWIESDQCCAKIYLPTMYTLNNEEILEFSLDKYLG